MISILYVIIGCIFAAVVCSDLLYRKIPNALVLTLLLIWCGIQIATLAGWDPGWPAVIPAQILPKIGCSLVWATGCLVVGFGLFCLGGIGAGDIKLITVLALWAGPDHALAFLITTALAGGVLALTMPAVSLLETAGGAVVAHILQRWPSVPLSPPTVLSPSCPDGIPYGLAIICGATITVFMPFLH